MKTQIIQLIVCLIIANPILSQKNLEKAEARLSLEYYKTSTDEYLKVQAKTKIDKRYQPVPHLTISIYLNENSGENFLGEIITGEDGSGVLVLPPVFYSITKDVNESSFIAELSENSNFHSKSNELTVKKVIFNVEYITQDSANFIRANVAELDSLGETVPSEGVEVKFFVERPLGELPVGDDYTMTDEAGNANIIFPSDIPGDSEGRLKVLVKIIDSEFYGNVEKSHVLQWGIPTIIDDASIKRSLWSSGANAPVPLLVLVNSLILAVWGILLYIVYKIFRISKI